MDNGLNDKRRLRSYSSVFFRKIRQWFLVLFYELNIFHKFVRSSLRHGARVELDQMLTQLLSTQRLSTVRVELFDLVVMAEMYLIFPDEETRLDLELVLTKNG